MVRRAHGGRRTCTDPQCRTRYAKRLFAVALGGLREAIAQGMWLKMLTLTLPALIPTPDGRMVEPRGEYAYRYMAARFNRLMTVVRRRYPMLYVRMVEEQRRGAPHYHLLVATRSFIPKRELSRLAAQAGLGSIVDIRALRSPKAAATYVTKAVGYVVKDTGAPFPRRMRFFSRSRLFAVETRADAFADLAMRRAGWSYAYLVERNAERVLPELEGIGYRVERPPDPVDPMYLAAVSVGFLNGPAGSLS